MSMDSPNPANINKRSNVLCSNPSFGVPPNPVFHASEKRHIIGQQLNDISDTDVSAIWHSSAEHGHAEILFAILESNSNHTTIHFDIDQRDDKGMTALHKSARCGHLHLCKLLVKVPPSL